MSSAEGVWPFVFVGGDPSLDLVNTAAWTRQGPIHERLTSYEALTRWASGAGLLDNAVAADLRSAAKLHPQQAHAALSRARQMLAALQQLFCATPGSRGATAL